MKSYYHIKNTNARRRISSYLDDIEKMSNTYIYLLNYNTIVIKAQNNQDLQAAISCIDYHHNVYVYIQSMFDYYLQQKDTNTILDAKKYNAYQEIDISRFNTDTIKQTIGKRGYFFIDVTEYHGINGIWHDKKNQVIQFWGDIKATNKAINEITRRLHYFHRQTRYNRC